nr:interferon alpha/beta receptor 2 isoform X1 [Nothobranchius furzeri]XP_054607247.1 interferon alpha/beta receptor 2 isoform X1 [Nothobranchius furzeri]
MNPLSVLFLLASGVVSLPAPANLSVSSQNLHHVLRWDPGPGSPPGTQYRIYRGVSPKPMKRLPKATNQTWFQIKLNPEKRYKLAVEAFYNQTSSPMSNSIPFYPASETVIGPPGVSLAGCGTCIQGNISHPVFDSQSEVPFAPHFSVMWRKKTENNQQELETQKKSFTLRHLEKGVEYCIRVNTKIRINKHTLPSNWTCSFTSPPKPQTDMLVFAVVAVVLLVGAVVLWFGLYYTGFICKVKKALPRGLMMALWHDPFLTLDWTVSDPISISSKTRNLRKPVPVSHPHRDTDSELDDDEEDRINPYMDRDPELSSGKGSDQGSANPKLEVLKDSGSLLVRPCTKMEELQMDRYETKSGGDCLLQEAGPAGVQEQITDEKQEEVQDISGNVNLFSVTLASLAPYDEEEEQDSTDFLRVCSVNLLGQAATQTKQNHPCPLNPEGKVSGYDSRCVDTWIHTDDEEEEEEELPEYLTHR